MKISEEYSMPIFSIPIRTKEFSSSYKSLFDIIQNEVDFEISIENIFLGITEIKDGTIGDIIQQVKDTSQKISVNCQLTNDSVQVINKRISVVNQIIEFESNYVSELNNQASSSSSLELKSNFHASFLKNLRDSFCGYASQVGWTFLNSFGINNDNYENSTVIFNDLIDIIPIEIKDLFDSLLNLTPLCHPDNFFLDQSIKTIIKLNTFKKSKNDKKKNVNKEKSNNSDTNFIEEEEEDNSVDKIFNFNDDTDFNDSQEILLMQNIDDYSMSTDEFVNTVEHILGQKDYIKISKSYDDENKIRIRPRQNYKDYQTEGENETEINGNLNDINTDANSSSSKSKETDYSRFFLFGKNSNNTSNEDSNISPGNNFLFSSTTPRKKASFVLNPDLKSTPASSQNNFLFNMPNFADSENKNKTPIKRSIKLDSSKKYAYTPEERRNKAKQISKFIKSTKESQYNNFSPFSLFMSPLPPKTNRQFSQKENTQPTYKDQDDYDFLDYRKPKKSIYSTNSNKFIVSDEDLSSLDQSNQLTEIIDFNIDDDINIDDNKKKKQPNYRQILSPDANFLNNDDYHNRKRKTNNNGKTKNVQFKDELEF